MLTTHNVDKSAKALYIVVCDQIVNGSLASLTAIHRATSIISRRLNLRRESLWKTSLMLQKVNHHDSVAGHHLINLQALTYYPLWRSRLETLFKTWDSSSTGLANDKKHGSPHMQCATASTCLLLYRPRRTPRRRSNLCQVLRYHRLLQLRILCPESCKELVRSAPLL
jgi:hypothetical protein